MIILGKNKIDVYLIRKVDNNKGIMKNYFRMHEY